MDYSSKCMFCLLLPVLFTFSVGANKTYIFTPTDYKLHIITFKSNFENNATENDLKFRGIVTITLNMTEPKEGVLTENVTITLNTNPDTKVISSTLEGSNDDDDKFLEISSKYVHENDTLKFSVSKNSLTYKRYHLTVEYSNSLRNDMTGFYRSSYVDSTNNQRWLLTTHFEPIYARKVFPCFDYPHLKATFQVNITAPKDKSVLCNTPVRNEKNGDTSVFICETSLPMSTYLVAFTVSDFIGTNSETFQSNYPKLSNRTLTTYGRKEIIEKGDGDFAQKIGLAAVTDLGEYLNIGYAFPKIDQVGIPDFSAGAMENWGHISFREKSLFYNKSSGSTITKQSNTLTITHELVHQWFGNLVTLESWNYIWLNEAFANYLEYVIASKMKETSDWELMKQFVVNEMQLRAFETDGLNSSKPLNNNITDESLILPSFNDIPYAKGASVLRMWENILGSEKFRKSLQEYLSVRAKKTANPSQLYEFFASQANMSEEFFSTWTDQPGYPLVEVKKNENGMYNLSQKRFLWDKSESPKTQWCIPITYTSDAEDASPVKWLFNNSIEVNITGNWIIVNNQQAGYYRVNYEQENWNALSKVLEKNHTAIDELNRAQIINDVYSLARSLQSDYVGYATALTLTKYLKNEESYYPWKTALSAFNFLRTKLHQGKVSENFNDYVLSLIKPHFKSLRTSSDKHIKKLMNIEMSRWACSLGLDACVNDAKELFKDSKYTEYPDVQEIVLCTVVKHLGVWDEVFKEYTKEQDSSLKIMYISALGCTNNAEKAGEFLKKTLAENGDIRKQDCSYVLSSVYNGNLKHIDIALKFIETNYKSIAQKYGGINPLGKALVGIAGKINSRSEYNRLKELCEKIQKEEEGKAAKDSLANALNIARGNTEWVSQRKDQFLQYFGAGSFVTYSLGLMTLCLMVVFQF